VDGEGNVDDSLEDTHPVARRKINQPIGKKAHKLKSLHELEDIHASAARRKEVWEVLAPSAALKQL
jgi:hypothetical protein